jgi:TusA-related sulfurtransferase
MKTSERFALNEWLSDYPDDMSYGEILELMSTDEWTVDEITVWEVVENYTLDQVSDFIENTRMHFERVTEKEIA